MLVISTWLALVPGRRHAFRVSLYGSWLAWLLALGIRYFDSRFLFLSPSPFFLGPVYPSSCFARSIHTLVAYNLVLMKLIALLFSLVALTAGAHAQAQHHYRRKVELAAVPTSSSSSTTRSAVGSPSSSPASGTNPAPSSTTTSSPGSISTGSSYTTNASPSSATSVPTGLNGVPPLSLISSGMSTGTSSPLASTYTPGATPPIPGAPPLPTTCTSSCVPPHSLTHSTSVIKNYIIFTVVVNVADWPTQDKLPDTSKPLSFETED